MDEVVRGCRLACARTSTITGWSLPRLAAPTSRTGPGSDAIPMIRREPCPPATTRGQQPQGLLAPGGFADPPRQQQGGVLASAATRFARRRGASTSSRRRRDDETTRRPASSRPGHATPATASVCDLGSGRFGRAVCRDVVLRPGAGRQCCGGPWSWLTPRGPRRGPRRGPQRGAQRGPRPGLRPGPRHDPRPHPPRCRRVAIARLPAV